MPLMESLRAFHSAASALGPGWLAMVNSREPCKNCFLVHYSCVSCRCKPCWLSKLDVLGLVSQVEVLEVVMLALRSLFRKSLGIVNSLQVLVCCYAKYGVYGENVLLSLFFPFQCGYFLVCCSVRVTQLVSEFHREEIIPYAAVDSMCSWEEMS